MKRSARKREALIPIQRQGQPPQRKVAEWNWDMFLEGYVTKSAKVFECDCGNSLPVPSHSMCKCGRLWNSYVIGTSGGEGREASIEKIVCREVPIRENVIVANKRNPLDKLYQESLGAMKSSNYNRTIEGRRTQMDKVDRFYREAVQNIEAEGKHRKDPNWGRSLPFESPYDVLDTPEGSYSVFQDDSPQGAWNVEHMSPGQEEGEVGDIYSDGQFGTLVPEGYSGGFPGREEAMDWANVRTFRLAEAVTRDERSLLELQAA